MAWDKALSKAAVRVLVACALGNGSLKRFEGHEGFTDEPDLAVLELGA